MDRRTADKYQERLRAGRWFHGLPPELQEKLLSAAVLRALAAEQPLGGQRDVTVADVQSLLEDHVPTQLPAEYDSWPQVWAGIKPLSAAG